MNGRKRWIFGAAVALLGTTAVRATAKEDPAADGAALASALDGQALRLTMRATSVTVMANAVAAEGGCAARIIAHAPGSERKWSRLFRWSEVAWAGATTEGATTVAFFEDEGRMPADRVAFAPADAAGFRATLDRQAAKCRAARVESERVAFATPAGARGCYFARLPGLQLLAADSAGPPASRAVLTVLARETPEAELQVWLERASGTNAKGDDRGRAHVTFNFADPRLAELRIAAAAFALDGTQVTTRHSLAAFGDTRLRISMDRFGSKPAGGGRDSFYRRLVGSGEARLALLDAAGQSRAVFHFDAGPALAAARQALALAGWSCAAAAAAPASAARWEAQH